MKKTKLISVLIALIMVFSYLPYTYAIVTNADNGKMKYYKTSSLFDVQGYVNGSLLKTTYNNGGYHSKIKVDNNSEQELTFSTVENQIVNGIKWDVNCSFVNNGRYVKATYTLTNTNQATSTVSLGCYADVQIGNNDSATIERLENSKGAIMYDGSNAQFSFYGKSVAGTTDIDNLWIGTYNNQVANCFNGNTTEKVSGSDSAIAFSWINRQIAAGEIKNYSVIIGVGEASNPPNLTLSTDVTKRYSQKNVKIKGTVTDTDDNDKAVVYYKIDNGQDKHLDERALTNKKLDFTIDLASENLSVGQHKIEIWAIDEMGNPSGIEEKNINITELKAPELVMSENWSKEVVKFNVKDSVNNFGYSLQYKYKIDEGQWNDIALNTETVALNNSGTAKVSIKAVDPELNEESSVATKTAKVDMLGPEVSMVDQDGKALITTQDAHSGLKSIKYLVNGTKELTGEEVFQDYVEPVDFDNLYLHIKAVDNVGNETLKLEESAEVVFSSKGGEPTPDIQYIIKGSAAIEPDVIPVKTGYTFEGWAKAEEVVEEPTEEEIPTEDTTIEESMAYDFSNSVTQSMTLEAIWKPVVYNINYETNGGINNENNPLTYIIEDTINLQPATKPGYDFIGWYEDEELTTEVASISNSIDDINLYAKWTPRKDIPYKVEHYKEGTNGNYELVLTEDLTGEMDTIVKAVAKEYTGYTENTQYESRIEEGKTEADGSLVLKLYYNKNIYKVSFEPGNNTNISTQEVKYQDKAQKPEDPTKDGYTFRYWYYINESGKEIEYDFDDPVTKDINLIAKWQELEKTIPSPIPQTGVNNIIIIVGIIAFATITLIAYRKYKDMKF